MILLLKTAFALFAGLMMTRAFKILGGNKFPDVTAFLLAGVLVGPYLMGRFNLGFTNANELESVAMLSNLALGFIAFDIGSEFRYSKIKEFGSKAIFIGISQAFITTIIVDLALMLIPDLPRDAAIILGAIASATAPAATLMVVRQFKAHGPVTNLLLPIVAIDDAAGLVIFAVSMGAAVAFKGGSINAASLIVEPLTEIIGSLSLGAVMGLILTWLEKLFFSNTNRLSMTIAFILMTISLASRFNLSALLVCMTLGTIFCNLSEYSQDIMTRSEKWCAPLYAVFFVLSGARLDLSVFQYKFVIITGFVYIFIRCAGKYLGALLSSSLMRCSSDVKKYLGVTLFPQAGVALGMVISAQALGSETGGLVRNIILFSVLIYELIGPTLTRIALTRAGEIDEKLPELKTRERFKK